MTVFVTGAANGIGRATVDLLLEQGEDVIAYDTDADGLQDLPASVTTYQGDVADEDRVADVVAQEEFDVLVNNAGYQAMGAVEDMELETVRDHYETNLFGMWNVTRAALPMLRDREGRVVNVSSLAGRVSGPFWGAYASSKHAVEGFSDALRREVAPFGVDVAIVEPGPVRTGFNEQGRDNLETYLPDSAYSDRYREMLEKTLGGVAPETAGKTVVTAVTADRPKPRYTVTWRTWAALRLVSLLPTRVTDVIVRRAV